MNYNDLLVAAVAISIGLATLLAGVLNWESAYRFRPARWIEASYGRILARLFYAALGLFLVALGAAVSQGWGLFR